MLVRDRVFADRTCVLTSATLELGGSLDAVAGTIGLRGEGSPAWRGIDVGSPFDYQRQAIVYVARDLPAPTRDGTSPKALDEIEALVRAAGGRTLGLFSSMRAAQSAAEQLRARFSSDGTRIAILCQGEDQISTLVRDFAREPSTCLFGTLTLWQGVDVPGSSCQLVVIDRIPFPRPDDPLASARSEAIARMGGNGFMAVSATHAALRLAQGSGRLVRRAEDRGVVAILDSRMVTARYAGFLQRSLPPFWPTTDRELVLAALARLDELAPPPVPVSDPALRGLVGASEGSGAGGEALEPGVDHRPVAGPPPVPPSARTAVTVGYAWTPAKDEALRDAVEAGIEMQDVVEQLELPVDAVRARLVQLGLELTS
jgi:ATP-dependent DNA helicase DinG